MCAILTVVSLAVGIDEFPIGLARAGVTLSVSGAWAFAALTMAESAELKVPRWLRALTYGLMAVGAGVVIAGVVAKYLR